jgi:hypothetical protein
MMKKTYVKNLTLCLIIGSISTLLACGKAASHNMKVATNTNLGKPSTGNDVASAAELRKHHVTLLSELTHMKRTLEILQLKSVNPADTTAPSCVKFSAQHSEQFFLVAEYNCHGIAGIENFTENPNTHVRTAEIKNLVYQQDPTGHFNFSRKITYTPDVSAAGSGFFTLETNKVFPGNRPQSLLKSWSITAKGAVTFAITRGRWGADLLSFSEQPLLAFASRGTSASPVELNLEMKVPDQPYQVHFDADCGAPTAHFEWTLMDKSLKPMGHGKLHVKSDGTMDEHDTHSQPWPDQCLATQPL